MADVYIRHHESYILLENHELVNFILELRKSMQGFWFACLRMFQRSYMNVLTANTLMSGSLSQDNLKDVY